MFKALPLFNNFNRRALGNVEQLPAFGVLAEGVGHVFQLEGEGQLLRRYGFRGLVKVGDPHVFKGHFAEQRARLERSAARAVAHKALEAVKMTVTEGHFRGLVGIIHTRKIVDKAKGVVPTSLAGQIIVFALDYCLSVGIVTGGVGVAVLDDDIDAAHTEKVAGGVENTAVDAQTINVDSRNAIVARSEKAVLNKGVFAAMEVDAVRATEAGDAAHCQIFAVVGLVEKIAAVAGGVALKGHVLAAGKEDSVGAAVALLTVRIVAIRAVDIRVALADNGDILLTVGRDDSAAVGLPGRAVILCDHFHIRAHLHALRIIYLVGFAIVAADELGAAAEIKGGIRVHIEG